MTARFMHVLFVVYFVEVGLVLIVAPWTTLWDRNYFVESAPLIEAILTSHAVRGGVTGLGIFSICAALIDVAAVVARLWSQRATAPAGGSALADATRGS